MAASDEWRKLMARELDVMSSSPNLYRKQFAGMGSVRLLDIPATISTALYFNVRDPLLADAAVRRRIAAGLNHQAIARIAGGDATSAAPPVTGGSDDAPLPSSLSLLLVQDESTMLLTGSVLRHEFDRMGIAVDVQPVNLERLVAQIDGGHFQMLLLPLPNGPRRFGRFLSTPPGIPPLTGFANPEYDAAVAASDLAKAQEILDRELPATVLFEARSFAAIDSRFCGDVTPSPISWRWMADLHLCDSDKGEGKSTQ
jgi:ABC-type oligopeptide transport system substrate-binding subunit